MGIKVLEGGLLTTVQDLGRVGFQRSGISVSGALDRSSLVVANYLVNNGAEEAGLEMTLSGARFEFTTAAVIAVTGADMAATLNGETLPTYRAVALKAGDILAFGLARFGCRSYLSVSGGFDLPMVLGSKSTNLKAGIGGLGGRALRAGDVIAFAEAVAGLDDIRRLVVDPPPPPGVPILLRAVAGPQAERFGDEGLAAFFGNDYTLGSRSDRMGCSLEGPPVPRSGGTDIISDGISLGAVQIASDGKPIVMLADRQTTGGYAKIAAVIGADLGSLAQARPGDAIRFVRVTVEAAQRIYKREKAEIEKLRRRLVV